VTDAPVTRPARLPEGERRRGLVISVVEGLFAQSHSALTGLGVGGNALTFGFALLLGAGDRALGLLAAIPPLSAAAQLVGAALVPRVAERRRLVMVSSTLSRVLWIGCGLLPLLLGPGDAALAGFLLLFVLSSALLNLSGNPWVSWMSDLVPSSLRAGYFALRNNACSAIGICVALSAGLLLDRFFGGVPRGGAVGADPALTTVRIQGFLLLFTVAAAAGICCGLLLRIQPEPPRERPPETGPRPGVRDVLVEPFRDALRRPGLRGFLLFVGLFGFVNGFAAPFWSPYQLEELRLPYATVNGTLVLVQGVAVLLALPVWGRIARRFGNRIVVTMALTLICTHPLYYLVATPERWWPMLLDAASSGAAWSGYNLAIFNLALGLSKGPRSERMFAVYATTAGLAQATSSALAGAVVGALPYLIHLGPVTLDRRQLVFLCASLCRVGCVLLFLRAVAPERGVSIKVAMAAIPYAVKALLHQPRPIPLDESGERTPPAGEGAGQRAP
jgi:Na+/melibiose symporter-like transporter